MTDIFQQVAAAIKIQCDSPNYKSLINQINQLMQIHSWIDFKDNNKTIEGELKQFFLFCLYQYFENQTITKDDLIDELYETTILMNLEELQIDYLNSKKVLTIKTKGDNLRGKGFIVSFDCEGKEDGQSFDKLHILTPLKLKESRLKYGYTRKQLSKRIGVSSQTIYYWENGRYFPKGKKLKLLNRLLA